MDLELSGNTRLLSSPPLPFPFLLSPASSLLFLPFLQQPRASAQLLPSLGAPRVSMAAPTATNPAHAHFESFLQAQLCQDVLSSFQGLCGALGLEPGGGLPQYHKIKAQLNYWSAKSLWAKLDKRASQPVYQQGRACTSTKCLVVGAGPCGLRAAVELAMLGAHVVVVEKRTKFSRHNVLHLWPFTIHDLRGLGAKKFYGRFCTGSLDHISIRQLQLLLLKVTLLLGVEIHWGVTFTGLQPPPKKGSGWRAQLQPNPPAQLTNYEFDVLISAAGGKFVPEGFTVREMRGKLAIGITANFVNGRTVEETQVPEISGVARIYNQSFFQSLLKATGIDLENIVYYKDDTHYFVMTAKKQCLLRLGVLRQREPVPAPVTDLPRKYAPQCGPVWAGPNHPLPQPEPPGRDPQSGSAGTQEELLRWCQEQTAGYPGVHVTDLSSSWADGLALCALVHRLRPSLLEPSELQGVGALEATSWALRMAEHELGITPVLSAQAVVAGSDPLGLIAYLSHFHSAFKNTPHNPGPVSPGSPGIAGAVLLLGKLQRTLQRTRAQENGKDAGGKKPRLEVEAETPSTEERPVPEPVTPPSEHQEAGAEDLCALCGEHLYILERLCADGRFFHRSCFRCHICEATLWPGGYGQHPEDEHFYCLQHLPQPGHKEDGSDTGPESQDLPTPDESNMPLGPSTPMAPQEGTSPALGLSQPTRRLIRLSSPERQQLSSLHLTPDPEMEPPPKPPRSCSALAHQALEGSFVGWGVPAQRSQVLAAMENEEESPSSSEEEAEEEEDMPLDPDTTQQVLWNLAKNSGTMNNYPTWRRTLLRRAKEEEMKRFCKAQAIQRRLNEIEVALRELEAKGTKLELALRSQSSSPKKQKALWLEQLLQLVQEKNSLVAEEAELMITVQELNLEEKQWQLDQKLRTYINREEILKTAADRQAEDQVLRQLVDVVNQRDALIRFREERRLSELATGSGAQG
ncbi:F-actin-monooxygenase MICAL1 isoform X6 [Camelus ferus]|uniref:Molecule interacting with CasL protein 1 n=1 Tax=Camelus ferus TaxID=419612 RepID=A0A8B8TE89_CAMFR|nr:F-actin-monooxygenase MICAL1 isoform X6 [Camelus ferus]